MSLWEVIPALAVLCVGAALYIWICLRFPPASVLAVIAYSMITKSASLAYIETVDVYLIEVGLNSEVTGATLRHVFYSLFIFGIALAIIRRAYTWKREAIQAGLRKFGTEDYNHELRLALNISAFLLAIQLINAILSPPYGLPGSGVDRQQFWEDIRFPLIADIIGVLVFFVPAIAGVALAYAKVTNQPYFRRFSIMLMLAYGIYFLLTGARFNGPLAALFIWLCSYWVPLWAFGTKLQYKRIGAALTLAIATFLAFGYREIADRGISQMTGSTWNGFMYRAFAIQGNVSFAADLLTGEGQRDSLGLLSDGMTTTVLTYMPSSLAEQYLEKGVNLAGSLPGNSILVFGYWFGLIPMAIFAILLGIIASVYIYIVLSGRFLLILPSAYLCLWVYNAEAQGNFANFFEYKFYLFASLVVLALLFPRRTNSRHQVTHVHTPYSNKARR